MAYQLCSDHLQCFWDASAGALALSSCAARKQPAARAEAASPISSKLYSLPGCTMCYPIPSTIQSCIQIPRSSSISAAMALQAHSGQRVCRGSRASAPMSRPTVQRAKTVAVRAKNDASTLQGKGREWLSTILSRFGPATDRATNITTLEFEKPLVELDKRIKEVRRGGDSQGGAFGKARDGRYIWPLAHPPRPCTGPFGG
jgi:hypothetical protein